jgi:MFS family permease
MAQDPEHDAVSEPNTTCIIQDSTKLSHDTDTGAKVSHNACDDDDDDDMEWKFKKNLYVLGITFCLLFLSYLALSDLQSSLFIDEGLGVVCQAVLYCSFAISCLFLPPLMIRQLGHKWTIVVAQFTYVIWMSANGYATWITMTITSFLNGMGAAVLWTAFGAYINIISGRYAAKMGKSTAGTTSMFFGITLAMFRCSKFISIIIPISYLQMLQYVFFNIMNIDLKLK